MAEASRAFNRGFLESISILTAKRFIDFPRREHFGVLRFFIILAVIALFDAAAIIFWLLVFGVNERRWKELATSN